MTPAKAIDLSLVILTYDRPDGLGETIASCLRQANGLGLQIEIVVIDNHPTLSGQAVVKAMNTDPTMPLRYISDLVRNMSALRNRGFTEAAGAMVAFIDDDEFADPDWTDEIVTALRKADAAIAVGPRHAHFAAGSPPAYDPDGQSFVRDLHLPDGDLIELVAPRGKPNYGLGTGNSLFDMQKCFGDGTEMMRTSFGDAGGEDAELFVRLYREGRTIVWAAKAIVTETVAPHRTKIDYRLIRTVREAQHYMTIYLDGARHSQLSYFELVSKGLLQIGAGGLLTLLTLEFLSDRRLTGRLLVANGLGKLTWNRPIGYIKE
jgi:succinoglycan biosynthesis protein ExoM